MDGVFLIKVTYFYSLAMLLAMLEIQIEGADGWAAKLPAWRAKLGSRLDRIYKNIFSGKELTGYHLALNIFLLIFVHWPFVFNWSWNIWDELVVLSIFIVFTAVWDFLWFVLNPKFSLRKFNPENVWWHRKWWGGLPADYYFAILGSVVLLVPEMAVVNPVAGLYKILVLVGVNLILVALTVIVYPKAY